MLSAIEVARRCHQNRIMNGKWARALQNVGIPCTPCGTRKMLGLKMSVRCNNNKKEAMKVLQRRYCFTCSFYLATLAFKFCWNSRGALQRNFPIQSNRRVNRGFGGFISEVSMSHPCVRLFLPVFVSFSRPQEPPKEKCNNGGPHKKTKVMDSNIFI